MAPLVSTIIPVFNAERYLSESLESAIGQEIPGKQEIIVVDDGSKDGSAGIVKKYKSRVRLIQEEHAGPAEARNRGIEAATGEYLAFLDADDRWPVGRLKRLLSELSEKPELSFVLGYVRQFFSPELSAEDRAKLKIPPELLPGYLAGGMLIRRKDFVSVGTFCTQHDFGEFIDWFNRAREAGLAFEIIDELVLERRIHGNNTTLRLPNRNKDYLAVIKAALDRRRTGSE